KAQCLMSLTTMGVWRMVPETWCEWHVPPEAALKSTRRNKGLIHACQNYCRWRKETLKIVPRRLRATAASPGHFITLLRKLPPNKCRVTILASDIPSQAY
ncbi:hypothetical protein JYU34_013551, partial [Plutella xylostella]